jgi:hypothetical protein
VTERLSFWRLCRLDGSLVRVKRRPQLKIINGDVAPVEAAAVIAAVEQYLRDTAPPPEPAPSPDPTPSPWKRAALAEGIARQAELPPQ